jgi:O6-methylguanine-DNA--protein-cysteine methyltransferase
MKLNPYAPIVPCHRVIKNDGSVGFFKGEKQGKAITEKINMLKKEGIEIKDKKIINFKRVLHRF